MCMDEQGKAPLLFTSFIDSGSLTNLIRLPRQRAPELLELLHVSTWLLSAVCVSELQSSPSGASALTTEKVSQT